MKRAILLLGFLVCVAVAGCGDSNSSAQTQSQAPTNANDASATEYVAPDAKGVKTMTVRKTAIPEYLDLRGAH